MTFIYLYLISIPLFIIGDLSWLGFIAKDLYQNSLRDLLAPAVNWPTAIVFYAIFLFGLTYFATLPAFVEGSLWRAVMLGALFGFVAYATYDLTNLATLKGWPLTLTIVDMAWGAFLGAAVSTLAVLIAKSLF